MEENDWVDMERPIISAPLDPLQSAGGFPKNPLVDKQGGGHHQAIGTLWRFNMAMENDSFVDDLPIFTY